MPHSKSTLDKYTYILVRDNCFQHLNLSSLFKVLPRVVLLDLGDNNPLLCHDIMRFQPPKSIKIISHCKYSTTEIPTYSTSEIPATRKTKPAKEKKKTDFTRYIDTRPVRNKNYTQRIIRRSQESFKRFGLDKRPR